MELFRAYASCVQAWMEFINVADHPREDNRVGPPYDRQSQVKQGVVDGPRRSTTREAEAARRRGQ